MDNVFNGLFNDDYVRGASRIGQVHEGIGLKPEFYVGAYAYTKQLITALAVETLSPTLLDHLRGRAASKRRDLARILACVEKVVSLDMGLVVDVYFSEVQRTSAKLIDDLLEGVGELGFVEVRVVEDSDTWREISMIDAANCSEAAATVDTFADASSAAEETTIDIRPVSSAPLDIVRATKFISSAELATISTVTPMLCWNSLARVSMSLAEVR